jgi:hypothetical protein
MGIEPESETWWANLPLSFRGAVFLEVHKLRRTIPNQLSEIIRNPRSAVVWLCGL